MAIVGLHDEAVLFAGAKIAQIVSGCAHFRMHRRCRGVDAGSSVGGVMTLRREYSLGHSEYNDFLFASVGEEKIGMSLTVLTALTRLGVDPWLHGLSDCGRTAAEVKNGRQPLGRERVERAAEPACLGFEHRGLAHSPGKRHDALIQHRSERAIWVISQGRRPQVPAATN